MIELSKAIRLVGLSHMRKLKRGYEVGWEEMFRGYFSTMTMQTLLNVGFIDELLHEGRVNVKTFAAARNLDPRILKALCESFYSLSLFQKEDSTYSLDSKGELLVEVLRGWFDVSYGYNEIFQFLEPLLRKEKVYGRDLGRRSDFVAKGSGEMENFLFFPLAIDIIAHEGYEKVLDLGCGDGTFLRELCLVNPDVTAVGIDLAPEAIEDGKRRAREAGLQDRIHLFAKDVCKLETVPEPMEGVEAATIFFVLHEILHAGEEKVIEFLRSFRSLFPGVPLIVFEALRPTAEEMRKRPGIAIYYFLYHDLSNQKPATPKKWRQLFRDAGFQSVQERFLGFARAGIYIIR
ncbi:MAG: class I SAM-dependent methyltransferase [Acidobacteriota bacterium]